jgi:hypothetical protein
VARGKEKKFRLTLVNNFVNNSIMPRNILLLVALGSFVSQGFGKPIVSPEKDLSSTKTKVAIPEKPRFYWKQDIITTTFWIGQGCTSVSDTTNYKSAWDGDWTDNYGGLDDPVRRVGLLPRRFAPTLNPFYVALPFNDVAFPEIAEKYVPWWKPTKSADRYKSQCKGHWIQIRNKSGRSAFGQWEDVGPLRYDHATYVFGGDRPRTYSKAGLDVSPAIRDFLGLDGMDLTDWRFVDASEVPNGPWLKYSEQAIIYSALKPKESSAAKAQSRETALARKVSRSRSG